MKNEKYSVVFSSLTGNTRMLADAVRDALGDENCEYFGTDKSRAAKSDMIYVGFWTDKGGADKDTIELLKSLKNKRIFLFGTAGFGGSEEYFRKILDTVKQDISDDNIVVGEYMCQGKMPQSVRKRYEKMKLEPNHMPNLDMLIDNFDKALSHPDKTDLENLKQMVTK